MLRLSQFLQRYHQVYVSPPTIARILRRYQMPQVSLHPIVPGLYLIHHRHLGGEGHQEPREPLANHWAGTIRRPRAK